MWHIAAYIHDGDIESARNEERAICNELNEKKDKVSNELQKRLKANESKHADYVSRLLQHEKLKQANTSGAKAAPGTSEYNEAVRNLLWTLSLEQKKADDNAIKYEQLQQACE